VKTYHKIITSFTFVLLCWLGSAASVQAANRDEVIFFFNDSLGSAVAAVSESGELCWSEQYTAYGDKAINDDLVSTVGCGIVGEERGFTGHTEDVNSDLVYMQQRYYDPSIGRFLSIDPVESSAINPVSFNRYAYGNNNPYKYTDPDGRKVELQIPEDSATFQAYQELLEDENFGTHIKELVEADEVFTIREPELKPTWFEKLFGSKRQHHAQYDPNTRTIFITPGVKTEVGGKEPGDKFFYGKTISHKGTLLHELGHAHRHLKTGFGDGSDGRPRQSERMIYQLFDNPFNGFSRGQGGKFVFPKQ